jgi:hypothetical protein
MDANNLYGWAMSQPLSIRDFGWMSGEEMEEWGRTMVVSSKWTRSTPRNYTTSTTNTPSHPKE